MAYPDIVCVRSCGIDRFSWRLAFSMRLATCICGTVVLTCVMLGRVDAIHVAPAAGEPPEPRDTVEIRTDHGLVGDRCARPRSRGQVTLIAREALLEAAAILGRDIAPGATRRNLTVSGLPLPHEKGARIRVGGALLEVTGRADPCKGMDDCLGPGGLAALEGRGGVRARVLEGAIVGVGAEVGVEPASPRPDLAPPSQPRAAP